MVIHISISEWNALFSHSREMSDSIYVGNKKSWEMELSLDSDDFFERLPDEIVLLIFKKVGDVKPLCASLSVCRRFRGIASQVDEVSLPILPRRKFSEPELKRGFFKDLVMKTLMKPMFFISQMMILMKFKSKFEDENVSDGCSYHFPDEILKPFGEIRRLHLQLPCNEEAYKQGVKIGETFLKWTAEYGQELRGCVILGAKSWRTNTAAGEEEKITAGPDQGTRVMSEDELKLRIVWTISCLIAASARHFLVEDLVRSQKTIENLVVSDESDQGKLYMNREMLEEMRVNRKLDETPAHRSKIPELRVKMWYLEKLELSDSGGVMEGPTLVMIRPTGSAAAADNDTEAATIAAAFAGNGEKKLLSEAVKKLMVTKKCYTLEMNSF